MKFLQSYKFLLLGSCLFSLSLANAQAPEIDPSQATPKGDYVNTSWQSSLVPDGVIDRTEHINQALGWQYLREADVMYSKRVWREIDTRQKQNVAFRAAGDDNSGGGLFIEILLDAVKRGKVHAYATIDDRFTSTFGKEQLMEILQGKVDTIPVEMPDGSIEYKVIRKEFNPDLVTKYRIKEDVMFDRNLGRMVTRIVGIAPMLDKYDDNGQFRASAPMFWLYYPELRNVLAQYEVFNPENDVYRMTWDEFFENRNFASYITKVSNPFDQTISNLGFQDTEILYEGQRQAEILFDKEHDMWVY